MAPDMKSRLNMALGYLQEEKEDLPWIKNEKLIIHRPIAIVPTTLLLFQTAMLRESMSIWFGKTVAVNDCRRRTCEVQSTTRRKQGTGKLRSRKGGHKKVLKHCPQR